jgi:hypothetical protein
MAELNRCKCAGEHNSSPAWRGPNAAASGCSQAAAPRGQGA